MLATALVLVLALLLTPLLFLAWDEIYGDHFHVPFGTDTPLSPRADGAPHAQLTVIYDSLCARLLRRWWRIYAFTLGWKRAYVASPVQYTGETVVPRLKVQARRWQAQGFWKGWTMLVEDNRR